jgi:hypothetical protein
MREKPEVSQLIGVRPQVQLSGWFLPVTTLIGGALVGAALTLSFVAMHSNWKRLAWVTPDAESTAPYWIVEGLVPVVISVGWTALILHARRHQRWLALSAALAAAEIALLAFSLIPVALAGNGGVWATNFGFPALLLLLLGGPIAAVAWPLRSAPTKVWWHVVAAIVLAVSVYVGFTATSKAVGA